MRLALVLAFAGALWPVVAGPGVALAQQKGAAAKSPPYSHVEERQKANENLVMLLGGPLGGPYLQLAQDIALATKDSDVRVLPVAGDGAVKNVRDVLLLRGVYLGITSVQTLNALKASGELGPALERQVAYIAPLSVDVLHVLARPEITTISELAGKRVGFSLKGSASATFGPAILKALGIGIEEVHTTPGEAVQLMREGKLDAAVCLCPMPVPAYSPLRADSGFRLLEVPYIPAFERSYLPATVSGEVYPGLVAHGAQEGAQEGPREGKQVRTIATSTVLVSFNWAPGSEPYRKIERFTEAFFSGFDKLRRPPRHPAWRSVNPAATIRGWQRFPAAQQWLDRQAAAAAARNAGHGHAAARAARAAPFDQDQQERLFEEFLKWSKKEGRR